MPLTAQDIKAVQEKRRLELQELLRIARSHQPAPARTTIPGARPPTTTTAQGGRPPESLIPPMPTATPPRIFFPLIDPSRTQPAEQKASEAKTIPNVPDWLAGLIRGAPRPEQIHLFNLPDWLGGGSVEMGDILPNAQQAVQPVTQPAVNPNYQAQLQRLEEERRRLAEQPASLRGALQAAGTVGQQAQNWFSQNPTLASIGGLPQAAMNLAAVPSALTEKAIGTTAQMAGIPSPVSTAEGAGVDWVWRAVRPHVAALLENAAALANKPYVEGQPTYGLSTDPQERQDLAKFLSGAAKSLRTPNQAQATQQAHFSVTLLATAAAKIERAGGNAEALKKLVLALAPQRGAEILDVANRFQDAPKDIRAAWDAASYTYESPERVLEARQRLEAGESYQSVMEDLEKNITAGERGADIASQMILDPLNLIGAGPLRGIQRSAARDVLRGLDAAEEAEFVANIGRKAGSALNLPRWMEEGRFAFLGRAVSGVAERTTGSRIAQVIDNARDHWRAFQEIADAGADGLRAAGVAEPPERVLLSLILDPDAEKVLRTGLSADELRQAMNIAPHVVADINEARALGLQVGDTVDILRSRAAIQTREMFKTLGEEGGNVWQGMTESRRLLTEANLAGDIDLRNEMLKAADDQVIKALDGLETAARRLVGADAGVGFAGKVKSSLFDPVQGFFATYFHMGLSPGWLVRNFSMNQMTGATLGVNMFSPMSEINDLIRTYGLEGSSGLRRSLGGGIEQLAGKEQKWWQKFSMLTANQQIEDAASRKVFIDGYRKTMAQAAQVMVPEGALDDLARSVGTSRANQIANLVRSNKSADLNDVVRLLTADEPYKIISDERILMQLDELGVKEQVQRLVYETPLDQLKTRLDDFVAQWSRRVDDVTPGVMLYEKGSDEAALIEDLSALVKAEGLSTAEQGLVLTEFNRNLQTVHRYQSDMVTYIRKLMDEVTDVNELRRLQRALDAAQAQVAGLRSGPRQVAMQAAELFRALSPEVKPSKAEIETVQAALAKLDQGFERFADDIATPFERWQFYTNWNTEQYARTLDPMQQALDAVANGVEASLRTSGIPVPAVTRPTFEAVRNGMWYAQPGQREALARLRDVYSRYGLNDFQVAHILREKGLLDKANPHKVLWAADIPNEQWVNDALGALYEHQATKTLLGKKGGLPEKLEETWREMGQNAGRAWAEKAEVGGRVPYDVASGWRAQTMEVEDVLDRLYRGVSEAAATAPVKYTPDELSSIRKFIEGVRPHYQEARLLSVEVAKDWRDFTLFNYGDRRNFDTALGLAFNYPFWYRNMMGQFVTRSFTQPGVAAGFLKFQRALERMNATAPEWFRDQLHVKTFLGDFYLPILQTLMPLNYFFGNKFRDPDADNTLIGAMLSEASQYGPGTHSLLAMAMAASAWIRGKEDERDYWMGYLGAPTRGIRSITALLGQAGVPMLPGGVGIEPWMWENGRFTGTKWENRRTYRALAAMVDEGTISQEQMMDVLINPQGPIFDAALQRAAQESAVGNLMSWIFGAAVKPRPDSEATIQEYDTLLRAIQARRPGSGAPNEYTIEEYRRVWDEMRQRYPWGDAVRASRRDDNSRMETYMWSVFNRLPPNSNAYWEAMGLNGDTLSAYLSDWYKSGGNLEKFAPLERGEITNAMQQMGAILSLPDDVTRAEWDSARQRREDLYTRLDATYPEAAAMQAVYFFIKDEQGSEAAQAYLTAHPQLGLYWNDRDTGVSSDPVLAKYYASMDMFERVARDNFEAEIERKLPGIHSLLDQYYSLKETDEQAAYDFLDEHPQLREYWTATDTFVLSLDEKLLAMSSTIEGLAGTFAQLRDDASLTTPGQASVAELIRSGNRPMGEFDLPADLDARQLRANLSKEIASIPSAQYGQVRRWLDQMGNLDRTLDAFKEFSNTGTAQVEANAVKLQALLAALGSLREEHGWALVGEGGAPAQTYTGGGGGGRGRVHSRTYEKPPQPAPQTQTQIETQFETFLAQLQTQAPSYWHNLVIMADMTPAQLLAFVDDPANRVFRDWLVNQLGGLFGQWVNLLLPYLKKRATRGPTLSRTTRRAAATTEVPTARQSNPLL